MKVEVAYSKMQHDSTLDAPKLLNDIQKQSSNKSIMFSKKEENTKCFRVKANKTIIPSKISSAYECKPSHSFPDLSSLKFFEHEWMNIKFIKSHSTDFSMHLV